MFLMFLEMVPGYSQYPSKALLEVLSKSNIGNIVKTPPILQVFSGSPEDLDVLDEAGDSVRVLIKYIVKLCLTLCLNRLPHPTPHSKST